MHYLLATYNTYIETVMTSYGGKNTFKLNIFRIELKKWKKKHKKNKSI